MVIHKKGEGKKKADSKTATKISNLMMLSEI